ncbi:MAG: gamma-glutamyl-gamma-aminobutyrate hydrolase family protein [Planctomycetes bacterium]|nr:gamma-glutamyl-gamma-aminobutyrate hydrolase family protein [Planctomycetota bacterium]MCW8136555.1 gamma-glutamyl-gamma-aminobutyrate hydrolase family protein [Planctomycetota bacterium]
MSKPIIAICTDHVTHFPVPGRDRSYLKLYPQYAYAVLAGGGTPMVLPMLDDVNELRPLLEVAAGVMLVGADDYPAQWFGKQPAPTDDPVTPVRAAFDRAFIKLLMDETDLPVFGVCGGMQLMTIHAGGALVQDLPSAGKQGHKQPDQPQAHEVNVTGGVFAEVFGSRTAVNSMHHQAIERPGKNQQVTATAPDGVVEAMQHTDHRFRIGVQWHPERMLNDAGMVKLFQAFVAAARR